MLSGCTGAEAIAMVNVFDEDCGEPPESLTWTVKEKPPRWEGAPMMAPVESLSANPGGSDPEVTLQ